MKRLLTGCLLALSLTGWGQLQFALEDPNVSFPPTTIDSTSTLSFVIINELSLPQEVSLTGLDAPFFPAIRGGFHPRKRHLECCD